MPPNQSYARVYRSASLHRESERLKTYRDWPCDFLEPRNLAKGGFYFTGTDDIVRCAFCGVEIGCWERGDDPDSDHKKWASQCDFVQGRECGNIPMSDSNEENSNSNEESGFDTCGPFGLEVLPFSGPERSAILRNPEKFGILKTGGPVCSKYSTYETRLRTFESWPKGEVQSPEKLAEAGFYYNQIHDNTLCFHCGGGLKNWEVDDDPWIEHARWFQKCGFINIQKGPEFVQEAISKKSPILSAENVNELSNSAEPIEIVSPPEESRIEQTPNCEEEITKAELSSESSTTPSCSTTNSNSKEVELCRICYLRERAIVFLPCGHFVACTQCAPSLPTCAVCRKPYEATIRAYLS